MAYIYRAINSFDISNINNGIFSSINMSNDTFSKEMALKRNSYLNIYIKNFGNCLDVVYGHIEGARIADYTTPWISLSTSLSEAISKYAIIQNGDYNKYNGRKPVIVVEEKGIFNKVIVKNETMVFNNKIRNIKTSDVDECLLVLNDNGLLELQNQEELPNGTYDDPICDSEKYNSAFNNHCMNLTVDYIEKNIRPLWNGISGYASKSNEVLVFNKIDKSRIVAVLPPLIQDILFNGVVEFDTISGDTKGIIDKAISKFTPIEKELFELCYGKDYLYDIHDFSNLDYKEKMLIQLLIESDNIYNINTGYNSLKEIKRSFIKKIINEFNVKIDNVIIPDDTIYSAIIDEDELVFNDKNNKVTNLICVQDIGSKEIYTDVNKDFMKRYIKRR